MLSIDNSGIVAQTDLVEKAFSEGAGAPLLFEKHMRRYLTKKYADNFEPRTVKIAKPLHRLLRGDLEPERIIKIDKPFMYKGEFPIWGGDSTFGINLAGLGNINGDVRYPSTIVMNDDTIHGMLAGATGQGKSVTMNSIVCGVGMEYAPWEVQIVMADAKIVEFKRYATGKVLPHISAVAATTDAEYIVSVLQDLKQQMDYRYSAFEKAGVQNIMDFREHTGLCIPRVFIPVDEFQAMFKNAGRNSGEIEKLFDDYVRLGRATGFHLVLASQEPVGIPKPTMGNITIRAALGCDAPVSETLLGNDEAKIYKGTKGRLIVNTKASLADKKYNEHHQVPLQKKEIFEDVCATLSDLGDEMQFRHSLSFYDQSAILNESEFENYVRTKNGRKDRIYLGEPSFVYRADDGEKLLTMDIGGDYLDNILVFCSDPTEVERYLKMLKTNVKAMGGSGVVSNIYTPDKNMANAVGLGEIGKINDMKDATYNIFDIQVKRSVYRRLMCAEADEKVFAGGVSDVNGDRIFDELFPDGELRTEMNKLRVTQLLACFGDAKYLTGMGIPSTGESRVDEIKNQVKLAIQYMKSQGCAEHKFTIDQTPMIFNWIIGIDRILGWGRDGKGTTVGSLKKLLQDCTAANVRFIISTTNMDELNDLKSCFHYVLMEGLKETEATKVGCSTYPASKANVLGVVYDSIKRNTMKFKKIELDGEVLVG